MTRKILVLDRQMATRRMLRFAMELQGFQVAEADDIPGALEAVASRGAVDLLVIGLNAADDDNAGAIAQVRRVLGLSELPILLVCEQRAEIERELRDIGLCAWLSKPFRLAEIHDLVERLLNPAPFAAVPATALAAGGGHA